MEETLPFPLPPQPIKNVGNRSRPNQKTRIYILAGDECIYRYPRSGELYCGGQAWRENLFARMSGRPKREKVIRLDITRPCDWRRLC